MPYRVPCLIFLKIYSKFLKIAFFDRPSINYSEVIVKDRHWSREEFHDGWGGGGGNSCLGVVVQGEINQEKMSEGQNPRWQLP